MTNTAEKMGENDNLPYLLIFFNYLDLYGHFPIS